MIISELKDNLVKGDRRAIAQAMTLVESSRPEHQHNAQALLAMILPLTEKSFRIGISGAPGVGKSTFIESFGRDLLQKGHRVAVLAIDPSSTLSKGSILADKTRMVTLSQSPDAFIRPSPSGGILGGTAQRTTDVIRIAEAAGFDIILIETVGVGQSELAVYDLSDMVLLLLGPALGDELQGIKKGIVEIADLIVINKADSGLEERCLQTAQAYRGALEMSRPRLQSWTPKVEVISAIESKGFQALFKDIEDYKVVTQTSGEWQTRRQSQAQHWLEEEMKALLWQKIQTAWDAEIQKSLTLIKDKKSTPSQEAQRIICENGGHIQV
ncbi:P-loop NTPase family protein [Candidatus Bealeia paramacronuclearis]|uniref:GTPase n=1 Tax=Candidatus Bealeia paramacronuclearis TaxID=1921001 RepID=A0ABZ2C3Y2_9PROT|nr:P-loop NTPase family protein [Candidatus Bealeia paramacronuclearis]MEB3703105.1 P-loop NTPase family protein [Candidatus Bealeia paramacronuclearis]